MALTAATSYTLDVLNFLNVLTQDEFYVSRHADDAGRYQAFHTERNQSLMSEMIRVQGGTMLSPYLTLVVSSLPEFDSLAVADLFRSSEQLERAFRLTPYYNEETWERRKPLFELASEAVRSLEKLGFREDWQERKQPVLLDKGAAITAFASRYSLAEDILGLLGPSARMDDITLYLCSYASPHGIKITGPRFISDVSYPKEVTLGVAIHEMFHPPYRLEELAPQYDRLKQEPLLVAAFEKQKDRFGYKTMDGFVEENVVEAMALFICSKIGLEPGPYAYLEKHDEGSHVLSVLLLDHLQNRPKDADVSFADYFNGFLHAFPYEAMGEKLEEVLAKQTMQEKNADSQLL